MSTRTVSLEVLEHELGEYIRIVSRGETVLVTDRDRVVAELRPPEGRRPLTSDAALADAIRNGWLSPPLGVREGPPASDPVVPLATLIGELRGDRDER